MRGIGHELAGDFPAAFTAYREGLELWRTLSLESQDVAIGLNNLADIERRSGNFDTAERDYREALRIAQAVDDREGIAIGTSNLALMALARKDWPSAENIAREAILLAEQVGRMELIAGNCHHLATALAQQGRKPEALPYAQRAVEIYAALRSPDLERACHTLAECER